MRIQNNIYLLFSLGLLSAVLVILIITGNSTDVTAVDKELFKVADQTKINKVILSHSGEQIKLEFNGIKWMLNDSLEADREMVKVFFATLLQAEPKRPVAQRMIDSVKQQISKSGTEVLLYEESELVKSFSVSGNDSKTETYYQLQNDNQAYVMTIPGYRVYVAGIFELSAPEWREKRIFNFNWQNFKKLTSNHPATPKEDFTVSFKDGYFGVEGISAADTTRLNDYLDAVSLIQASRFIGKEEASAFDSLFAQQPWFTIKVEDIANRNYKLEVYNVPVNNAYFPARLNGRDGLLLEIQDTQRISWKKEDFIK